MKFDMRAGLLTVLVAALVLIGGVFFLRAPTSPPAPTAMPLETPPPVTASGPGAGIALTTPATTKPTATTPTATASNPAPASGAAAPPAGSAPAGSLPTGQAVALPPLPEVDVQPADIHDAPEEAPAPEGHPLDLRHPPDYAQQNESPQAGAESAAGGTAAHIPRQFGGRGRAVGPVDLAVEAAAVRLFGVQAPDPGARCVARTAPAGGGLDTDMAPPPVPVTAQSCAVLAERRLAALLARGPVHCRRPTDALMGAAVQAVCLDARGIDLGGDLVDDGLARADTRSSYDYVGAESIARQQGRGMWQSRR